jgi:simple sugar transport system ATP-binding protein/ribose transport system ATP-binding protein
MSDAGATSQFLELLDVSKHFGGVQALEGVTLSVGRGSVHALVGENGAGKSTLGRIVAGALTPDAGTMVLESAAISFRSPREALEHGVAAADGGGERLPRRGAAARRLPAAPPPEP